VPMLGTHNSYSNPHDGSSEILSNDQFFTITDQLNLGARFIRIDPVVNFTGTSVMVCHSSDSLTTGMEALLALLDSTNSPPTNGPQLCALPLSVSSAQSLNGVWSYQRPVYLALEEIQYWLANHPGEVVVITVNNFYSSSDSGYITPSDLYSIFAHVMGNTMLTPTEFQSLGSGLSWPTLRQFRALGKQALVMFAATAGIADDSGGNLPVWQPNLQYSSSTYWNSTTMPDFLNCEDWGSYSVGIGRPANTREEIGEDRSLSNRLNQSPFVSTANENGLMTWLDAAVATGCGYSTISLDYFYSLIDAVNDTYFYLGNVNYTTGGNFYSSDAGKDERPQWTIWSWLRNSSESSGANPAALVHQDLSGDDLAASLLLSPYPATVTYMTYRWEQMPEADDLPFACAGPDSSGQFPDPTNMWNYQWAITTKSGPWANGETECQQEFGSTYHFWRPMSAPENNSLAGMLSKQGAGQVWLNHYPGNTVALPLIVNLSHTVGGPQTAADIVVTSGFGGALSAAFTPGSKQPDFISISQPINGSNIFQITINDKALASSPSGNYQGTLIVTEQHPDNTPPTTSNVFIGLSLTNAQFTANPGVVDFASSLTQTVQLTSSPKPVSFTYEQKQIPAWLTVSFNTMTTPASMTLTADPSKAGNSALANITLTPGDNSYQPVTILVSIAVDQAIVGTSPNNAIPLDVDGAPAVPGATLYWVAGSPHQLSAPTTYSPQTGTTYTFKDWTGAVPSLFPSLKVTATGSGNTYTAQYNTYYALTTSISPNAGGSLTMNPAPSSNGYLAGTQVTLTATPAAGYEFQEFTGAVNSQQSKATLNLNAPASVTAVFVVKP
jgi:hypothetical protein